MLSAESKTTRTATSLNNFACSSRMRRNYELCYICEIMDSLDLQAFDKDVNKQNLCVQAKFGNSSYFRAHECGIL